MAYTADELIEKLGLLPHREGGWFRFIGKTDVRIPREVLPSHYPGDRYSMSTIYYFLKEGEISKWHQLHSDEIWTWHYGSTLELTFGGEGKTPVPAQSLFLGSNIDEGEAFQITVPAHQWQEAHLPNGGYALVSCIVSPAYEEEDCYMPDLTEAD